MSEVTFKLTPEFKKAALKLFSIAFNCAPKVKEVKKLFPVFDARKKVHWMNLVDKSNDLITQNEIPKVGTREFNEFFGTEVETITRKYQGYAAHFDFFTSPSAKIYFNGVMGTVGYNAIHNKYFSHRGYNINYSLFDTLEKAIASIALRQAVTA